MTSQSSVHPARPPPAAAVADAAVRQRRDRVFGRALGPLAATAGHELVMFPKAGRIRFSTFLRVPYSTPGAGPSRPATTWR